MSKIRNYVENYTFYRKLSNPEWKKLKGRVSNKGLIEMDRKQTQEILLDENIPGIPQ